MSHPLPPGAAAERMRAVDAEGTRTRCPETDPAV